MQREINEVLKAESLDKTDREGVQSYTFSNADLVSLNAETGGQGRQINFYPPPIGNALNLSFNHAMMAFGGIRVKVQLDDPFTISRPAALLDWSTTTYSVVLNDSYTFLPNSEVRMMFDHYAAAHWLEVVDRYDYLPFRVQDEWSNLSFQ